MSAKKNAPAPKAEPTPAGTLLGIVVTAFATCLLALYQWMELLIAHQGGKLACAINETFNCTAVWDSAFAKGIQGSSGLPLAAWGLVWGLAATGAGLRAWVGVTSGAKRLAEDAWVLRLIGGAGVLACLVFAAVSLSIGAVCVTCVLTYWIVFTFAFFAWRLPTAKRPARPAGAAGQAAAWAAGAFALLLYPGLQTPLKNAMSLDAIVHKDAHKPAEKPVEKPAEPSKVVPAAAHPEAPPEIPRTLAAFVGQLPPANRQMLSDGLAGIRASRVQDVSRWPARFVVGEGPARLVEFTDIKCGHCARFVSELHEIHEMAPPGSFSIEPRQYPLDAECNPSVPPRMTDGSGVRCTAAKALICLENRPTFFETQIKLFGEGAALTRDRIIEIAGDALGDRGAMRACVESGATKKKLAADIEYANAYELKGTPLVLINGREVPAMGAFVYGMILAGGNPDAAEFQGLPPPRPEALTDPHAGHGH